MKKFLRLLNEFLNWREEKEHLEMKIKKLKWDLDYCRRMLIDEAEGDIDPPRIGEIKAYVSYIKKLKEDEIKWTEESKKAFLEAMRKQYK